MPKWSEKIIPPGAQLQPYSMNVNITSPAFKADPYPFYARMRAEAPVHRVTLPDKREAWLVVRYAEVAAVLKDERFIKDRFKTPELAAKQPWMPKSFLPLAHNMLDRDPPDHTRLRSLVHKVFTPRLVEEMRRRVQSLTDEFLDASEPTGKMDLIRDYALPLPSTIIAEMLGVPAEDRHRFHRWTNSMVVADASKLSLLRAMPGVLALLRYVRKLVKKRRTDPRDDLASALVRAEEAGDQLSEDELVAMIVLLLIAGHETTVNLIGNATLALIEHPEQMDQLRRNPAMIQSAVEEMLRYDGPLAMATERFAGEDVSVSGVAIPRNALVFAVLGSANRDEQQFPNPDNLDLARADNKHVAFGLGIHYCLGAPLARLEGQIAISTLLRRAPALRLAVPRDKLRWRRGFILRGLTALPVAF
jgi:cytochrome P450